MGELRNNRDGLAAERNYSGTQIGSAAVLIVLALLTFLILAHFAVGANGLTEFDLQLSDQLKDHARESPLSKSIFHWFTVCGNTETLAALSLAVAMFLTGLMLLKRRVHGLAAFWIIATTGVGLLNIELKSAFQRPRPDRETALVRAGGWSYPSGHAMGSFVVYGMLAYVIVLSVRRPLARNAMVFALAILVLGIGFSRIYLGAHWPSDVLGGFMAGTVWLSCCIAGSEYLRRQPQRALAPVVEAAETAGVS